MSYLAIFSKISSAAAIYKTGIFAAISALFAAFGRLVRGVTTGGSIAGAAVCFVLLWAAGKTGFTALFTVFALTWLSTRLGYARKQRLGTAEARSGRDALQVLANLGTAAGCAVLFTQFSNPRVFVAMAAALAEAAADTVSSEIGQGMGGTPRLITTWQKAAQGTNGAITAIGTAAGAAAAVAVALVCLVFGRVGLPLFAVIACSGLGGTIIDSLLGATVEGRARLGNNAVNFISTMIAAILAFAIAP
ncbi:MAG TPA: DUF92 domain-containing protein [Terriglobales bacterium]|nr:DUF92 domain-containing protein [Terriglobales bacterium]